MASPTRPLSGTASVARVLVCDEERAMEAGEVKPESTILDRIVESCPGRDERT
jgi:hypothetical protein